MYIGNFPGLHCLAPGQPGRAAGGIVPGWRGLKASPWKRPKHPAAAAFRLGYLAVASGLVDVALVVGVEKYTDVVGPRLRVRWWPRPAITITRRCNGMTPAAQAGLLMQRYLYEYGVPRGVFGEFPHPGACQRGQQPQCHVPQGHPPRDVRQRRAGQRPAQPDGCGALRGWRGGGPADPLGPAARGFRPSAGARHRLQRGHRPAVAARPARPAGV